MSDSQHSKPNLDLIQMVQNARMIHDEDALPSQITAVYWIEAKRKQGDYPNPTPKSGEWRIQTTLNQVDALWAKIKEATEMGSLGYKSKVSTKPGKGQGHPEDRLICVRSYDGTDKADRERIYHALLGLGISPYHLHYHFDYE